MTVADAAKEADIIMILVTDEKQGQYIKKALLQILEEVRL